jgi:hypothetical protein
MDDRHFNYITIWKKTMVQTYLYSRSFIYYDYNVQKLKIHKYIYKLQWF